MKITTVFLFLMMLNLSASVYSQSGQMDLNAQDKTMREVLRLIESKSDYRFFYNDQLSDLNSLVSINAKNKSVKEILDRLLGGRTLTYMVLENNMIVIAPGDIKQQQKVVGTVTDAKTGEVLPGVN
ncbi:MAG TPA: STN domain-containing protein, partial [Bacteroidales bacterium]|nr:STN domain-containing protein [Bacteroidales bacterium]